MCFIPSFVLANEDDDAAGFKVSARHYEELSNNLKRDGEVENIITKGKPGDVHVLLFFSYGCYGCAYFNTAWQTYVKEAPKGVVLQEVPITWNRAWRQLAKAFYTTKSLSPKKDYSEILFASVQKQHKNIANPSILAGVLESEGLDKKQVISTFESFHIEHEVNNANTISGVFGIKVSPSVVIIGPNKIYRASLGESGTADKFLKVIQYLV